MDSAYEAEVILNPGFVSLSVDRYFVGLVAEVTKHMSHMLIQLGYGDPDKKAASREEVVAAATEHVDQLLKALDFGRERKTKSPLALRALGNQLDAVNRVFWHGADEKQLRCDVFQDEDAEEPINVPVV